MVTFYKPKKTNKNKHSQPSSPIDIDALDWKGQGVGRGDNLYFVSGALPNERCTIKHAKRNKSLIAGQAQNIENRSEHRVSPFCDVADTCGGCQLQHIEPEAALALRDDALKQLLMRQLNMHAEVWQPPLSGARPAYRRKARFAIDARHPHTLKMGFREKAGNAVIDIQHCPILQTKLSALIAPLKKVLASHDNKRVLGHVSVLAGDNVEQVTVKHTQSLAKAYTDMMLDFAQQYRVNVLLEDAKGHITPLHLQAPLKCHTVDGYYLMPGPNDFVQVNPLVNQKMIHQALAWLSPQPHERIADWFCGLGNFTLPIAKSGAEVQAVEGVAQMVQRAKENALAQGITNIDYQHLDLSDEKQVYEALAAGFDKVLIDPSREGALTVCHALAKAKPNTIVYVSCNPSTFSRDARVLLEQGYKMKKAGVIEMFPYTQHMEMMALFTRQENNE